MTGITIRRAVCRLEGAFGLTVAFELLKAPAACFGVVPVVFDHDGDAQPRGFCAQQSLNTKNTRAIRPL